jgi:hypothetical protein
MAVLTEQEVAERVMSAADGSEYPAIDTTELDAILSDALRYTVHSASTAYEIGDRVITAPTGHNGRLYRAITAGSSAATAPTWPKSGMFGSQYSDGPDLIWEDAGPRPPQQWDVDAAIRAALMLKSDKCAKLVTQKAGDDSRDYSDMARAYQMRANRRTGAWVA